MDVYNTQVNLKIICEVKMKQKKMLYLGGNIYIKSYCQYVFS